jgi:hypothetical protein
MIERVERRFDLKPERLIGDMAYGAAPMLGWLVEEKQIAPHIPVRDMTQRNDETLSSSDFQWDEQADQYRCPQGHVLRSHWRAFMHSSSCVPTLPKPTSSSIGPANPMRDLLDEGASGCARSHLLGCVRRGPIFV